MATVEKRIPRHVLMKVLNRHRRLKALERMGVPDQPMLTRERAMLAKALDEFEAWAEEHGPDLFYTEK